MGPRGAESALERRLPQKALLGTSLLPPAFPGGACCLYLTGVLRTGLAGFRPPCCKVSSWETRAFAWSLLTKYDTSLTLHSLC